MTETKNRNFTKNVDGTTVICYKIDGMTVISNLVRPPLPGFGVTFGFGVTKKMRDNNNVIKIIIVSIMYIVYIVI